MKKLFWFLRTKLICKFAYGHIGKKSYIAKCLFVNRSRNIYLGDEVRIYPGMRAEIINSGRISFDGDNSVGQNLHIVSGSNLNIGYGTTISSNVFISNVDHSFRKNTSAIKNEIIIKETLIGKYCFIGTGAVILPGTILGDNVIVGANSTVKGVFPDNCVIAGSPAKIIKRME